MFLLYSPLSFIESISMVNKYKPICFIYKAIKITIHLLQILACLLSIVNKHNTKVQERILKSITMKKNN